MENKRKNFQRMEWPVEEEEETSTSFTYVETIATIESHNPTEEGQEAKEKDETVSEAKFEGANKEKKKNERLGNSLSEDKMTRARERRLLSLQKQGNINLGEPIVSRRAHSLDERLNTTTALEDVGEKLRLLSTEFNKRASRKKAKIQRPITPTSDLSCSSEEETTEEQLKNRLKEFFPTPMDDQSTSNIISIENHVQSEEWWKFTRVRRIIWKSLTMDFLLDSQSRIYIGWLVLMAMWFFYNAWVIPLRWIFPFQTPQNVHLWFIADSIADFFYFVDTFILRSRVMLVSNGFTVKDPKEIRRSYFASVRFRIGLLSLIPVDICFAIFHRNIPWLRAFRLLKMDCFREMFLKFDSVLSSPHPIRIARSILYMLYLIHMYACAYYSLSTWETNAGYRTDWIFNHANLKPWESYIRCFYFATKTASSIGKNPKPENEIEYLFMTCAWLSGVFAFAILIGQIRDIIATATKNQTEYRQLLYAAVNYLHQLDVPKDLQERVKLWITYTWQQQRTLDEQTILSLLPTKMQTDIALHVHIEMLNKVKLFQSCEVAFLRDLVPRLRSVIFLPGDYVCRKGEKGKEMYIVKTGSVDVIGGDPGKEKILASLGGGSIFGEIALLQVDGMDKRTADVRSAGFSNLFVLSKKALGEVIKDYPAAQESLRKQAKKLLRLSQKRKKAERSALRTRHNKKSLSLNKNSLESEGEEDIIIKDEKFPEPKMIETVLQVLPPDSKTAMYLQFGRRNDSFASMGEGMLMSYPPSPFIAVDSRGFGGNSDISLDSSLENISTFPLDDNILS